jgi:phosphoenolpyruvate synthase/pyruvate phosphate dikinase
MVRYVLDIDQIDLMQIAIVGGKAAGLGALARIEGVRVPRGFCVTTDAFRRLMAEAPRIDERLERLSRLAHDDREASADIRESVEAIDIPNDVAAAIEHSVAQYGVDVAYAVRSSATAEDLPTASFAGQQDTFLNVIGRAAILDRVRQCWASLFSERAVTYRLRNGIDSRQVSMAVIVQQTVFPRAAGILFTADPVSGNRKVSVVEAGIGLGEVLVSGLTNADRYRVRDGAVVSKTIATKQRAVQPSSSGGTEQADIDRSQQDEPALSDAQVVRLAALGRRIESHFGRPQDIEWCLVDDDFWIVQSRPITTLFPIPEINDGENHVYISVGHQQMMTDAMKPLGISVWQMSAAAPMYTAGGRLFVDVARALASPASRDRLLMLAKSDPLIGDALATIVERGDFVPSVEDGPPSTPPVVPPPPPIETDPTIVEELVARNESSIATLKTAIRTKTGPELLDFILSDFQELRRILFDPRSTRVFMTAMEATWWLNEKLEEWLGEKNAADTLTQSVPNNVTSEMGLALLDVADVIRPHRDVVTFLENANDDDFLNALPAIAGGREARDAIQAWLDKYGMRGVGEIDITRPRWNEHPSALLPLLLSNVKNFTPGAAQRRFEQGRQQAWQKEQELLARLRALPDGAEKAVETKRMIDRVRTFIGYREYPKYGKVSRDFVYKQALFGEAERLVEAGVLHEKEDIFYLTFDELRDVVRTHRVDERLIRERKAAFEFYQRLTPPRVLTSEGEVLGGSYRRNDVPEGTLVGLAVSSGIVEGRARVIVDIAEANLEPGDILVTTFTDPSWTPLFVAIKGLVTEVGGLMTHGAVIAREYGLPAVVGVEHATRLIRDGQRIRIDGTNGYVEFVP